MKVAEIRMGENIQFDAWLYSMLMDNNIAYNLNPHLVASQEQLSFMVQLEENQVYLPCSDQTFALLGSKNPKLQAQYNRAWRIITRLIRSYVQDSELRKRLFNFCQVRFRQYIAYNTLLPSRLIRRMTDLLLKQSFSSLKDPWIERRKQAVERHQALMNLPDIQEALNEVELKGVSGMAEIRQKLNELEIIRLFCLTLMARTWEEVKPDKAQVQACFKQAEETAHDLLNFFAETGKKQATILYISDADGSPFFDLMAIKAFIRMGHKIIYAVKAGFHFYAPTIL